MRIYRTLLLVSLLGTLAIAEAPARTVAETPEYRTVTFRFVPGRDMFYIPFGGNDAELNRLHALVDEYRGQIASGAMPVCVDGYCASAGSRDDDLKTAAVRANRVKSELITNKGLVESNFTTRTHAGAYEEQKDIVVVTLRIPVKEVTRPEAVEDPATVAEPAAESGREEPPVAAEPEPVADQRPGAVADALAGRSVDPVARSKPWCFAVSTNLLYDAFLLPTLGVEWRVNRDIGIKLGGSLSYWGDGSGRRQKTWFVSPEVRWYLSDGKRFHVGAGANIGVYNIYGGMPGGLFPKDTGYQGDLWSAGVTVGYRLPLSRGLSLDFDLGLGYTSSRYDSFRVIDGVRVFRAKGVSKNFWGPTQAGVNLVWTIGGR
jgi:hypothetical protein